MTKIINKKAKDINLEAIAPELVFLPAPTHRQVKTKFWTRFGDLATGEDITLAQALQITGEPKLTKWWPQPGFKDWFMNKDEAKERLEYLWYIGMDALEAIFLDPDANHNAKVQAFREIAKLAGKEPANKDKFVDEDIQRLDAAKLRAYILKHAPRVLKSGSGEEDKDEQGDSGEDRPKP